MAPGGEPLLEEVEPPHWSGSRRWWVLLSFSFLSFTNAFILMDFADDYTLAEEALGLSGPDASSQVAFLYTLFLICVMPAMLFASWGVVNYNWTTMLVGQSSNVICAWLRYAAVRYKSYAIAVVSTVFGGVAGAAVVCSYGVIAETWFRPSQRGLATTVAVQSNYAGWAAGSLLGLVANGDARFFSDTIMLAQAVGVTMCIPLFFGGYRGAPAPTAQEGPVSAGEQVPDGSMLIVVEGRKVQMTVAESARTLFRNSKYWVHAICYACFAGIGFSVPSAQDVVFGSSCASNVSNATGGGGSGWTGYDTEHTTFTNLSFILSGVIAGLIMGAVVRTPQAMDRLVLGEGQLQSSPLPGDTCA